MVASAATTTAPSPTSAPVGVIVTCGAAVRLEPVSFCAPMKASTSPLTSAEDCSTLIEAKPEIVPERTLAVASMISPSAVTSRRSASSTVVSPT